MDGQNHLRQKMTIPLLILLCSLATALTATNNPLRIGNTGKDSSVFTYVARTILRGGMPYRDTFDHKGPIIYLIDAAGLRISHQFGVWLLELISIFFILFFANKLAQLLKCGTISACGVIILTTIGLMHYLDGGNVTEEYACVFIALSLYVFVKYFVTGWVSNAELVFSGTSLAVVCFLRVNMAALWVVMCIGVIIYCLKSRKATELPRFIIWFLVGGGIVSIPILVWLVKNNTLNEFVNDYIKFNFLYSSNNGRASIEQKMKAFSVFCRDGVAVLCIPSLLFFSLKERKPIDILCLVSSLFTLAVMSMSGQTYPHYGLILVPFLSYSSARTFRLMESEAVFKKLRLSYLAACVCLIGMLFTRTAMGFCNSMLQIVRNSGVSDNDIMIASIIQECTNQDDKISVCGNHDIIYLLSDRVSASVYSYQSPIATVDPRIKEEYLNDIEMLKASVIVVTKDGFLYKDLSDVLESSYDLVDTVATTEIYRLKNLEP